MCDAGFSYGDVVDVVEVAFVGQFLSVVFALVLPQQLFLHPYMMSIHKEDLVLEEHAQVMHDVGVVQENFIVDEVVDALQKFLIF